MDQKFLRDRAQIEAHNRPRPYQFKGVAHLSRRGESTHRAPADNRGSPYGPPMGLGDWGTGVPGKEL